MTETLLVSGASPERPVGTPSVSLPGRSLGRESCR